MEGRRGGGVRAAQSLALAQSEVGEPGIARQNVHGQGLALRVSPYAGRLSNHENKKRNVWGGGLPVQEGFSGKVFAPYVGSLSCYLWGND